MKLIFHDAPHHLALLPLTFARPLADWRLGILTIAEKWQRRWPEAQIHFHTVAYLQEKYPLPPQGEAIYLHAGLCATDELVTEVATLKPGEALKQGSLLLAYHAEAPAEEPQAWLKDAREFSGACVCVEKPWDIFRHNGAELRRDYDLLTRGRTSASLDSSNTVLGDRIFVEEGVEAQAATFNAQEAPIYLGNNSKVLEGSLIKGGLAMGPHAVLKMGAKIYGPTTLGPYCKVGGEVNNSVFHSYSNKGHDGFLGNAVIGQWCNLGADTNNSNLKNNYDEIKVWSYARKGFTRTGLQFCGLLMGDHSKCGINTMFNTGTVVGFSANIFGAGFPRTFIPSFSWGGAAGFSTYRLEKALDTAQRMMARRDLALSPADQRIFEHIFHQAQS
jgi:UDP-N-acetylglucosamine diphosphorylase/glucosamine-1-phosphate N-acetyltransferase